MKTTLMKTTLLKEALVSFLDNMAVGDYCHVGGTVVTRTQEGFDIEDNGEGVSVGGAEIALEIALENEVGDDE